MRFKEFSESSISRDLRDPKFAVGYLEDLLESGSVPAFLEGVRDVARANGGMGQVSKGSKLGRESLYKALSKGGNPQFSTLQAVLRSVGLRFSIALEKERKKAA